MWHQFSLHALTYCRLCKDGRWAPMGRPTRADLDLRYGFDSILVRFPPARVEPHRSSPIIRSYHGESTGSHPNSEVKHHWACSVLRWGTTWESQVSNVFAVLRCREVFWAAGPGRDARRPAAPRRRLLVTNLILCLKYIHQPPTLKWPVASVSVELVVRCGTAPATTPTAATTRAT